MRSSRDITAVLILLALFIGGAVLLGGHGEDKSRQVGAETAPDPSVYNDRPSGSKGVYEWVGRLGYHAAVWRRDWQSLPKTQPSVLMVIDPQVQDNGASLTGGGTPDKTVLSSADASALQAWVQAGNTAILMTSRMPSGQVPGGGGGPNTFADTLGQTVETASPHSGRTEFAPQQPLGVTEGILSVYCDSESRVRQSVPEGVALFGDGSGSVILMKPMGRGRLITIADGAFASNSHLTRSENAVLLANLLAQAGQPGATILFDEYHHGDADLNGGGGLWNALGRPLQLFLIQLALAAVVLCAALAVRFGAPIPLLRGVQRTSGEYVASLAGLYQRAGAATSALDTLYRQFLRDLCLRLALPPDVSLETLAEAASRRGQTDREALRRLLAACEQRLDDGRVTDHDLLDIVRRMERVRKDLGLA